MFPVLTKMTTCQKRVPFPKCLRTLFHQSHYRIPGGEQGCFRFGLFWFGLDKRLVTQRSGHRLPKRLVGVTPKLIPNIQGFFPTNWLCNLPSLALLFVAVLTPLLTNSQSHADKDCLIKHQHSRPNRASLSPYKS